ncbi:hypothetical protein M9458_007514, partial [Cirrhinus mrigala]
NKHLCRNMVWILVRIKGKMNAAMYRDILKENLLQSAKQDNDPKRTAKMTKGVATGKRLCSAQLLSNFIPSR